MSRHKRRSYITFYSILSGILLWISWPERGLTPVIFIAFVPLFFAEYSLPSLAKRNSMRIFGCFFLAMFIWNALTTWWIYNATDVGSIVAIGLNSLFMAIVWQLFFIVKRNHGPATGYLSLLFFWIAFEYLHLKWEISWPWLTLGNVFSIHPSWVQWYEYTGVLGGTAWILIVNMLIFQLLKNLWYKELLYKIRRINILLLSAGIFIVVAIPLILSLNIYYDSTDTGEKINVVLLQPNIDPYNEKFSGNSKEQLTKLLRLSLTAIDSSTDYCIGPETALPESVHEEEIETNESVATIRTITDHYRNQTFIKNKTASGGS